VGDCPQKEEEERLTARQGQGEAKRQVNATAMRTDGGGTPVVRRFTVCMERVKGDSPCTPSTSSGQKQAKVGQRSTWLLPKAGGADPAGESLVSSSPLGSASLASATHTKTSTFSLEVTQHDSTRRRTVECPIKIKPRASGQEEVLRVTQKDQRPYGLRKPAQPGSVDEIGALERQAQFFRENDPERWSDEAVAHLQEQDAHVGLVRRWIREEHSPTWGELAREGVVVKTWWERRGQLLLSTNNVLYIMWEHDDATKPPTHRVVAVAAMFQSILKELHDVPTAGHLGQKKTIARVKRSRFYWPGMSGFARRWVAQCNICASRKHSQYSRKTPLSTYRVGTPMDRVSIDLTGPFNPVTYAGNCTILTVTDQFTRWVEAFALKEGKASYRPQSAGILFPLRNTPRTAF